MKGDIIGARSEIALSVRMLNASGVAMRFAGDITSDCYLAVRESMMPPNVPNTFSGLWSTDHRAMIDGLRSLQRCMVNINTMSDSDYCLGKMPSTRHIMRMLVYVNTSLAVVLVY